MTREERDLHGALVPGSDHLTAYNLLVEAVNQCSTHRRGARTASPRLRREGARPTGPRSGACCRRRSKTERWRWRRSIARSISSCRRRSRTPIAIGAPHSSTCSRGSRRSTSCSTSARWMDRKRGSRRRRWPAAGARSPATCATSPTASAPRARASRGRRSPSTWCAATPATVHRQVVLAGHKHRQGLGISRRLAYFGFELEHDLTPHRGRDPRRAAGRGSRAAHRRRCSMARSSIPIAAASCASVRDLDEYWRRSGGALQGVDPATIRALIRAQLEDVTSGRGFQKTPITLDVEAMIPLEARRHLDALPTSVRIHGDASPIGYEVRNGLPIARLYLREGQARRLRRGRHSRARPAGRLRGEARAMSSCRPRISPDCRRLLERPLPRRDGSAGPSWWRPRTAGSRAQRAGPGWSGGGRGRGTRRAVAAVVAGGGGGRSGGKGGGKGGRGGGKRR